MEEKKRIGFLTLVIAIAGIIFAAIDALVSLTYAVVPPEPSNDFFDLVINGPIWWKINPVIIITLISVGIIAFLLGSDGKFTIYPVKRFYGFLRLGLTFVIISLSGLGDILSQTFNEIFAGHYAFSWLTIDWWWTRFMPIPALIAFLIGHNVPTGIDMVIGSVLGVILLVFMWLHYYGKLNLAKIRNITSV